MSRMLRRSIVVFAILIVFVLVASLVLLGLYRSTPSFYVAPAPDPAAAASAERKLTELHNWVARTQADAARIRASATPDLPRRAAPTHELRLTQAELNAAIAKWSALLPDSAGLGGPMIAVGDEGLILAAKSTELGTVVGVHLAPRLDEQGSLRLSVARVTAGRLPLPERLWRLALEDIVADMRRQLPRWRASAAAKRGTFNNAGASLLGARLLLDALEERPSEPFIPLPVDSDKRFLPVEIAALQAGGGGVVMNLKAPPEDEAATLLARISARP